MSATVVPLFPAGRPSPAAPRRPPLLRGLLGVALLTAAVWLLRLAERVSG